MTDAKNLFVRALRREIPADDQIILTGGELVDGSEEIATAIMALLLGHELGRAVAADFFGTADRPNTALAPSLDRRVVCKWACRLRRNAGLPVRCPKKGIRRGRKPKNQRHEPQQPGGLS